MRYKRIMCTEKSTPLSEVVALRRNFFGGLWHAAFLAFGMALTQPTTVIPAFVAQLTGSTIWVGGLVTVLTVAGALPQLFVARLVEPRARKMPLLMVAIHLRVVCWGLLAALILSVGASRPLLLAWSLMGFLGMFYACGGLGGVPYTDIVGKIIPSNRRGAFFGGKEALAGPASVSAALIAGVILAKVGYPGNYALLFGLAAAALLIASVGFWIIREPPRTGTGRSVRPWAEYRAQLIETARRMRKLVGVELLTGFSLMALPFYVVYALQVLAAPPAAVGWFVLVQVVGGVLSNLLWARLVDRHGSRKMITVCAVLSSLTPLLAVIMGSLGWPGLMPVFFLSGVVQSGRKVGFATAVLELAPSLERPTYAALNSVLVLPVALLPLVAGVLLHVCSYAVVFVAAAVFIGAGACLARRWAQEQPQG